MIYREFQGLRLSALGFGMMRLPVRGAYNDIDEAQAAAMLDYAMRSGVNYYDTAWGYHDGESERIAGKLLSRYPARQLLSCQQVPPATTFPIWTRWKRSLRRSCKSARRTTSTSISSTTCAR